MKPGPLPTEESVTRGRVRGDSSTDALKSLVLIILGKLDHEDLDFINIIHYFTNGENDFEVKLKLKLKSSILEPLPFPSVSW